MAIRLASAIGQQREPVGILGGLDEAINKTGDAVQQNLAAQREAERKRADQEQKLKDLIAGSVSAEPIEATDPQRKEYESYVKDGMYNIAKAAMDRNIPVSQLEKMKKDFEWGVKERQIKYKRDFDTLFDIGKKAEEGTHITSRFDDWLMGKTDPTQVAEMPNDDFAAASEADRAGKMVGERGMKATPTETVYQGKTYFELPFEEQKKIDTRAKANELITPARVGVEKAAKAYFGKDWSADAHVIRTQNKEGGWDFVVDEKGIDNAAKRYASSMLGNGNFGSKEHQIQQKAYEAVMLKAGNDAGYSGQKLAEFVREGVAQLAYDDYVRNAQEAVQNRLKNQKEEPLRREPKGIEINNTIGGGGQNKQWRISSPVTVPVKEGATVIKTKDKDGNIIEKEGKKGNTVDYDFYSIETVATGENPKKINFGGYTEVQLNGVYKDKKTGDVKYVKLSKDDEVILAPIEKQSDLKGLKNNIGEEDFDKFLGLGKYKKETPKTEAPKAEVKKQEDLRKKYKY